MDQSITALKKGTTCGIIDGNLFIATMSPCSMYLTYGLQIEFTLIKDGDLMSKEFVHNPNVFPDTASEHDVQTMIDSVKFQKCPCCGTTTFVSTNKHDTRNGRCELCFKKVLDVKLAEAKVASDIKLKKQEAKLKQKGFNFKIDVVVHGRTGSDKMMTHYMVEAPTDIEAFLKKRHPCAVHLDFGKVIGI